MQVVNPRVESRLLARFANALVNVLLGFSEHLLNARRVDAAVSDEVFHRDTTDFAANGVEA